MQDNSHGEGRNEWVTNMEYFLEENSTKLNKHVIIGFTNYMLNQLNETQLQKCLKENFKNIIDYLEERSEFVKLKPFKFFTDPEAELLVLLVNDYMSKYKV